MLEPRLQGYQPRSSGLASAPVGEDGIAWLALLGGTLPATAVALRNARRLRITASRQFLIVLIGLLDFAAVIAVHRLFPEDGQLLPLTQATLRVYVMDRMIALFGCLLFYRCWRQEYRTHLRFGGQYLLFGQPNLLALYALGPLQWLLTRALPPVVTGR